MGTSSKGKLEKIICNLLTKKDKEGKQTKKIEIICIRKRNSRLKIITKKEEGRTLTKKDMYDKDGKFLLSKGKLKKKWQPRSKY